MTVKHLRSLIAVALVSLVTWGCHDAHSIAVIQPSQLIVGSGRVVTESRPVSAFSEISVSLPARVVIAWGGTESLSVTAGCTVAMR